MQRNSRSFLGLALLIIIPLIGGCAMNPNEEFVQGTWYFDRNPRRLATDHLHANEFEYWTFDNGRYHFHTCCLLRYQEQGRYQIVKSEGSILILELFEGTTRRSASREIRIEINKNEDALEINGTGPFYLSLP